MELKFLEDFLKICTVEENGEFYWNAKSVIHYPNLLFQVAQECKKKVGEPDYICALGTSGLALATLVADAANKPLLWMQSPNFNRLVPTRRIPIRGKKVTIVDDHAYKYEAAFHYCWTLTQLYGAELESFVTAVDADIAKSEFEHYKRKIQEWCKKGVRSLTSISELCRQRTGRSKPFLKEFSEKALKESFWRPQKKSPSMSKPELSLASNTLEISLETLDNSLAKEVHKQLYLSSGYLDPWNLIFNSELLDKIVDVLLEKISFDVVAAVSYWALPFALLVAKRISDRNYPIRAIFCLDSERHPALPELSSEEKIGILLVDDTIKGGGHLQTALKTLKNKNLAVSRFIVILDNTAWPKRADLFGFLKEYQLSKSSFALTSSSFKL